MRLRLQPFDRDQLPLGPIYAAILTGGAVLAATWLWLDLPRMICPLRRIAGLPCPTCGSTRLIEAVLQGDFLAAFAVNPLVLLTLVGVMVWSVASSVQRLFAWPAPQLVCTERDRWWIRVAAIAIVFCGWAYVVVS